MPQPAEKNLPNASGAITLDPRTRILATLLFILSVNLVPLADWWLYLVGLALVWSCIAISGASFLKIWLRTLATLPFLLAALAIPFTTPGAVIWKMPGVGWPVTSAGIERFGTVLVRFLLAVQATVTLASVTPAHELLQALGRIGVPAALVAIIGLMHRYLSVIGDDAARMLRARAARSARMPGGRRPSPLWQTRVAGSMIGSLFVRAVSRGERLHMAMRSRGFDGTIRSLEMRRLRRIDWIALGVCAAATLACILRRFA
ncbi:MAG: cobalt ECF transporter T component CbiQ [Acidobacteriota bacterium]